MELVNLLFLIIGIALGFVLGFFMLKNKQPFAIEDSKSDDLNQRINELTAENGILNGKLETSREVFKSQADKLKEIEVEKNALIAQRSQLDTSNKNLTSQLNEQKRELEQLQEKFTKEFTLIANKLLKQSTTELAENQQKRLNEILQPLKENIKTFESKIEDKYEKEIKDRTSLIEQIKSLKDLNQQMSQEANNLTKALKGDNKTQGNWGELILEKVLESSGLIKDEEYKTQYSTTNEQGNRLQPDVVVMLPDNKHVIVDAKVSLNAYQNYINTDDESEQTAYLKDHLLSVKTHIKTLSEKQYSTAEGINSPDFVLLFMPIEPSFGLAMRTDNQLYQYAWDKKIVIVTPSTLLATLKTIKSVWNNEKQTKNALEIARQAGALHDKFVGFVEDMERIKKSLEQSNTAYDKAFNKLKTGKGNLIDATMRLEKLGAKTKKNLSTNVNTDNNTPLIEE